MVLVVDPWHWLTEDGHFLVDNPRLYRRMLRIARFIEYGGKLQKNETRETLVECKRRPRGKACPGLMWVVKTDDDAILAHCMACKTDEAVVHNWQQTEWAEGMMEPVPVGFLELVAELRPNLHRYCSRLVGSAIDGEDVLQEALAKAYYAMSLSPELPPLQPWLLRIAHNTAVDFLRRYDRRFVEPVAQIGESVVADAEVGPEVVRAALSSFLALPVLQRSSVILKDVLGLSLEEIAQTTGTTVPAVKAALSRGRTSLRELPVQEVVPWRDRPETTADERKALERYVALFNARDWDGVQALLTEECRLDLVSKSQRRGRKQVAPYFGNYAREDVRVAVGRAEGRDVLGVYGWTRPVWTRCAMPSGSRATWRSGSRISRWSLSRAAMTPRSSPSSSCVASSRCSPDIGLLPENLFKNALKTRWLPNPDTFVDGVQSLWDAMNGGKTFWLLGKLLRFNGGLFADPVALPLTSEQLFILHAAAEKGWADVEPATADYVMYWWNEAVTLLAKKQIERFGLITTNTITQTFNRQLIAKTLDTLGVLSSHVHEPRPDRAGERRDRGCHPAGGGSGAWDLARCGAPGRRRGVSSGEVEGRERASGAARAHARRGPAPHERRLRVHRLWLSHMWTAPPGSHVPSTAGAGFCSLIPASAPVGRVACPRNGLHRPRQAPAPGPRSSRLRSPRRPRFVAALDAGVVSARGQDRRAAGGGRVLPRDDLGPAPRRVPGADGAQPRGADVVRRQARRALGGAPVSLRAERSRGGRGAVGGDVERAARRAAETRDPAGCGPCRAGAAGGARGCDRELTWSWPTSNRRRTRNRGAVRAPSRSRRASRALGHRRSGKPGGRHKVTHVATIRGKDQEVLNGIQKELQSIPTMLLATETYSPQTLADHVVPSNAEA
jgi:RNA polymerase sigma-70 factor, ECF subfamily